MKKRTSVTFALLCLALCAAISAPFAAYTPASAAVITTVVTQNSPPIAENLEFTTFRSVPVSGKLEALDPDGDLVTFVMTGHPGKGTVEIAEDGSFTYTPKQNKKGRDTFTYAAVDTFGNRSTDASVTVSIKKQASKISYSDMDGQSSHYAALRLAEEDVFIGENLGGEYFFRPELTVTRGEFLAMCMRACGIESLDGVVRTGFYDDEEMPLWVKPYVAAALLEGTVSGYSDGDGRPVFHADSAITNAEASVLLNNVLEVTDVSYGYPSEDCPVWAAQACMNLSACNIPSGAFSSELTRADAAEMLSGAMDIIEARS